MDRPAQIVVKNVRKTQDLTDLINKKVAKLEKICSHMMSCRVAIERPQQHIESGNPYRVRIDMTVPPGHELVAKEESGKGDMHEPLPGVLKNAFHSAERQLKKLVDKQQGQVKTHPQQEVMGIVNRIFPEKNYGFIKTVDTGEDIYFHRNSVMHDDFDRIKVGTGVRFEAEQGEKGLQASSVEIMYKPGSGVEIQNQ